MYETRATRFVRHHPRFNAVMLALLRSPLHRLVSGSLCELDYVARSDGRAVSLPVGYARHGDQFVVLVGDAAHKSYWRTFRSPHEVTVRRGGDVRRGIGRIVHPDHPSSAAARSAYERRRHVHMGHTDRLLLIDPIRPSTSSREASCASSPARPSTPPS